MVWHLTKRTFERWLESLLHIHDTPERTAAAFGVGVAIGFSPFVGLHTLIGLVVAIVFNLNRVAVFAGLWVNLPWFMGPYYAATTALGCWITGTAMPPQFLSQLQAIWALAAWRDRMVAFGHLLRPLLLPYTLGALIGAVPIGFVTYRGTLAFIHARRRHRPLPDGKAGQ
jgi:uncharacterized protein (DUF2062 family)